MNARLDINGGQNPSQTNFVSWAPSPAKIRLTPPFSGAVSVPVTIRNQRTDVGGQLLFYTARGADGVDELTINLPGNGSAVDLFVGGKFPHFSVENGDAVAEIVHAPDATVLGSTPCMVRVRRNANKITVGERNRFLAAMGTLNASGNGRFTEFRAMHNEEVEEEAHRRSGFLPWHRAYLLDLERELQAIDPSVTLPYWKFDEAAPNLFTPEFIGRSNNNGSVTFGTDNPLALWRTDGGDGINRLPDFDTANDPAFSSLWQGERIAEEADVLAAGGGAYRGFWAELEGNPHGYAHTSFSEGFINSPDTAPKDPLFFLLHCNVDRLWAMWQWINRRHDPAGGPTTFFPIGRVGHRLGDTMWPWNGSTMPPRPTTPAPGGGLANSPIVTHPGEQPRVRDMIDYQGKISANNRLDFDYDDVPFEWANGSVTPIV